MAQINQLDTATPALNDLTPFYSQNSGDTRACTFSQLLTLFGIGSNGVRKTQYASPNTDGFTVQIGNPGSDTWLLLTPASDFGSATIVLPDPATNVDGQEVQVTTTKSINALSVTGGAVNPVPVYGAPTNIAGNSCFVLRYDGVLKAWFPIFFGEQTVILSPVYPSYGRGVTVTTSATAAPFSFAAGNKQMIVTNTGTNPVYVRFGSGTATAADYLLLSGMQGVISINETVGAGSAISPAGASSLNLIPAEGF